MKTAVCDFTLPQNLRVNIKEPDVSVQDVTLNCTVAYALAGKIA